MFIQFNNVQPTCVTDSKLRYKTKYTKKYQPLIMLNREINNKRNNILQTIPNAPP